MRFKKIFRKKEKSQEDYYLASQWTLMGRKLKKHRLARISLIILGILYFGALFGQFLAPYGLEEFDGLYRNSAPTKIHFMYEGEFVGPYVYKLQKTERISLSPSRKIPRSIIPSSFLYMAQNINSWDLSKRICICLAQGREAMAARGQRSCSSARTLWDGICSPEFSTAARYP